MMKIAFHPFGDGRLFILAAYISGDIPALQKRTTMSNWVVPRSTVAFVPKESG